MNNLKHWALGALTALAVVVRWTSLWAFKTLVWCDNRADQLSANVKRWGERAGPVEPEGRSAAQMALFLLRLAWSACLFLAGKLAALISCICSLFSEGAARLNMEAASVRDDINTYRLETGMDAKSRNIEKVTTMMSRHRDKEQRAIRRADLGQGEVNEAAIQREKDELIVAEANKYRELDELISSIGADVHLDK